MPIVRAFFTAIVVAMAVSVGRAFMAMLRPRAGAETGSRADERASRRASRRDARRASRRTSRTAPHGADGSDGRDKAVPSGAPNLRREDIIDVSYEEVS